jgi:hypothetical protein
MQPRDKAKMCKIAANAATLASGTIVVRAILSVTTSECIDLKRRTRTPPGIRGGKGRWFGRSGHVLPCCLEATKNPPQAGFTMLPPQRGLAASPQQESSAHDGRVSGDSIPIWSVTLTCKRKQRKGPANLAHRLDAIEPRPALQRRGLIAVEPLSSMAASSCRSRRARHRLAVLRCGA